eukprot:m.32394 g.32394  ORF g.32394 m.32394 type:complete len:75 (-) comp7041_c0_seq1:109-333(-)
MRMSLKLASICQLITAKREFTETTNTGRIWAELDQDQKSVYRLIESGMFEVGAYIEYMNPMMLTFLASIGSRHS